MRPFASLLFVITMFGLAPGAIALSAPLGYAAEPADPQAEKAKSGTVTPDAAHPEATKRASAPARNPMESLALNFLTTTTRKLDKIQASLDELKKTTDGPKEANLYIEIGLAVVAGLGLLLAGVALWQTARLHRHLVEHTKLKGVQGHS